MAYPIDRWARREWLLAAWMLAAPLVWLGCPADDDDDVVADDDDDDDDSGPDGSWNISMVEDLNAGYLTRTAFGSDGSVAVATFNNSPYDDGLCDEIEIDPPQRYRQPIYLVTRAAVGQPWDIDTVDEPIIGLTPTGLSLAFDPQGRPAVAYTGGEPELQYCGGNDAVLAVREGGEWSFDTAGAAGGESATGDPAADSGFTVGFWPALAYDGDGNPAMVYQDAHYYPLQHDDIYRADAEFAWSNGGGSWDHEAVDYGEGAGDYNSLAFDHEGRPVAVYAIAVEAQDETRHGVWAARRSVEGEWVVVKLHTGGIHNDTAVVVDPDSGELVVAFYSVTDRAVRVRRLGDAEQFDDAGAWSTELVARAQYDEGRYTAMAFMPSGELALAYHRCRLLTAPEGSCDSNDEAVIFATSDGGSWDYQVVVESEVGSCGEFISMDIAPTGTVAIAYRCTVQDGNDFLQRLFVATTELR